MLNLTLKIVAMEGAWRFLISPLVTITIQLIFADFGDYTKYMGKSAKKHVYAVESIDTYIRLKYRVDVKALNSQTWPGGEKKINPQGRIPKNRCNNPLYILYLSAPDHGDVRLCTRFVNVRLYDCSTALLLVEYVIVTANKVRFPVDPDCSRNKNVGPVLIKNPHKTNCPNFCLWICVLWQFREYKCLWKLPVFLF